MEAKAIATGAQKNPAKHRRAIHADITPRLARRWDRCRNIDRRFPHRPAQRSVRSWGRLRAGRHGLAARDHLHHLEERLLPGVMDAPVDRDGLVARLEGLAREAIVEIAP